MKENMKKGIDINQRINFTFQDDTSEPKTVFVLRPLARAEFLEFSSGSDGKNLKITAEATYGILERSTLEIQNYQIGDEVINAKDAAAKRRVFEALEIEDLSTLLSHILEINRLGKAEQKNS